MFPVVRKMTSGSSSSENTPLLNGSQEGPCYAYSYAANSQETEEKTDEPSTLDTTKEKLHSFLKGFKTCILLLLLIFCVVSLCFVKTTDSGWNSVTVTNEETAHMNITSDVIVEKEAIHLRVRGPFLSGDVASTSAAVFTLSKIMLDGTYEKVSEPWLVLLAENAPEKAIILEHDFYLDDQEISDSQTYQLSVATNERQDFVTICIDLFVGSKVSAEKIIIAIFLVIGFHALIIFEFLHRTLAAMMGATAAVSCLALVNERPSVMELMNWMNIETLCLVFGLILLTSVLCETGVFEFAAVLTYKVAGGHFWIIFTSLCFITVCLSAILDPLTAVILMSALAIRLCEAMNMDPKHVLIPLVIFSHIGSIVGYRTFLLQDTSGIGYGRFTLHLFPALLLSFLTGYVVWRLRFRDISVLRFEEPLEVVEVKREQEVWRKAYHSLANYSKEEENVKAILKRKIAALETLLRKKLYDSKISTDDFKTSLKEMTQTMKVKNRYLLYKSCSVTVIVLILLLLRNVTQLNLSSGWIAVLGALCLLVLGDFDKLESVLSRVEWPTLVFLASLFVFMEAVVRLDLVDFMVREILDFIRGLDESKQLLAALLILLWVSALSSTLIIPFSAAMMEAIKNSDEDLSPVMYALVLGACLGANGSLLGGSANVVSAGLAEQHGYRFSYSDFFKVGFPIMLLTTTVSMAYLLICHIWIGWND